MKKQDERTNAFIILDKGGKIIEADFTANEKGGTYRFDNFLKEYSLKAGQRIFYRNGKNLKRFN